MGNGASLLPAVYHTVFTTPSLYSKHACTNADSLGTWSLYWWVNTSRFAGSLNLRSINVAAAASACCWASVKSPVRFGDSACCGILEPLAVEHKFFPEKTHTAAHGTALALQGVLVHRHRRYVDFTPANLARRCVGACWVAGLQRQQQSRVGRTERRRLQISISQVSVFFGGVDLEGDAARLKRQLIRRNGIKLAESPTPRPGSSLSPPVRGAMPSFSFA